MGNEQKRISIGHALHCDVVVPASGVRPHHCTIVGFQGSWQIVPEMGRVGIGDPESDDLRWMNEAFEVREVACLWLTDQVRLPWPDEQGCSKIGFIGRASDCEIVLDRESISGRHAKLLIGPHQTVVLADNQSRNGVYLSPPFETRVKSIAILAGNHVYLASHQVDCDKVLREILGDLRDPQTVEQSQPGGTPRLGAQPAVSRHGRKFLLVAGNLILLGVLLAVYSYVTSDQGVAELSGVIAQVDPSVQSDSTFVAEEDPPSTDDAGQAMHESQSAEEQTASSHEPKPTATRDDNVPRVAIATNARNSTFWVMVFNEETNLHYRIGTAFAVGEYGMVTTASVIQSLNELQDQGYSKPVAIALKDGKRYPIEQASVLPEYNVRKQRAVNFEKDYQDGVEKGLGREELERLARIVNFSYAALSAVDIGFIASPGTPSKIGQGLAISAVPSIVIGETVEIVDCGFRRESPAYSGESGELEDVAKQTLNCRVIGRKSEIDSIPGTLEMEVLSEWQSDLNVLGMPVFFRDKIIGMVVYQYPQGSGAPIKLELVCAPMIRKALSENEK